MKYLGPILIILIGIAIADAIILAEVLARLLAKGW